MDRAEWQLPSNHAGTHDPTQNCPDGVRDFRAEQCAEFDGTDFQGRRYRWLPYYAGKRVTLLRWLCGRSSIPSHASKQHTESSYRPSKMPCCLDNDLVLSAPTLTQKQACCKLFLAFSPPYAFSKSKLRCACLPPGLFSSEASPLLQRCGMRGPPGGVVLLGANSAKGRKALGTTVSIFSDLHGEFCMRFRKRTPLCMSLNNFGIAR